VSVAGFKDRNTIGSSRLYRSGVNAMRRLGIGRANIYRLFGKETGVSTNGGVGANQA